LDQYTAALVAQLKDCNNEKAKAALVPSLLAKDHTPLPNRLPAKSALHAVLSEHWCDPEVISRLQELAQDNPKLRFRLLAIVMDEADPDDERRKAAISALAESLHVPIVQKKLCKIALSPKNSYVGSFTWAILNKDAQSTALANTLER
jgi:hypothetical protein